MSWRAIAIACLLSAPAHAQQPAPPAPPVAALIEILDCVVYSAADKTKRHDCTAKARELCRGAAGICELPIGLALTAGRDLDGDRKTWEKVRINFRCGQTQRVHGPHDQNDHATALLECRGF